MAVLERQTVDSVARTRVETLEVLCAELYQVAGELGAPERVLDQLWAAAQGEPLPHGTLLPFHLTQANPGKAAAVLGMRGGKMQSAIKTLAAQRNGMLGGRPRKTAKAATFHRSTRVAFKKSARKR